MYRGIYMAAGKEIKVYDVEAIDKGTHTFFKGKAAAPIDAAPEKGMLHLQTGEGGKFVIKDCVIEKGGTDFEGYGVEVPR